LNGAQNPQTSALPAHLNELKLQASLLSRAVIRYSPQGLPICEFELQHSSTQVEAGLGRSVQCTVKALAMGAVCNQLQQVNLGEFRLWSGFLAQRSLKSPNLRFHVTSIGAV